MGNVKIAAPAETAVTCAAVTEEVVARLIALRDSELSPTTLTVAKQCLLDWFGVALGGRREPLVGILVEELASERPKDGCAVIGLRRRAPLETAVLINGAMSHALDFDDVHLAMGHPAVSVAPVVLALAEQRGLSAAAALRAFVVGVEAECMVGVLLGPSHYAAGWHSTATCGTFGAAAAAATLLGLDAGQWLHCFGLAGTQAAGLKSVFGTMSKPLHPGKSAQNGLLAARLARRGFTSDPDILGSAQGFADTQSTTVDVSAALAARSAPFVTDTLFKYHAACYLTHDTIEAANRLRVAEGFSPDQIEAVTVQVQPKHLGVCNIEAPRTGLECKFSLRMTAALALSGEDTFEDQLFSDAMAARPDLVALRKRVRVEASFPGPGARVDVRLRGGATFSATVNVAEPDRDLDRQQAALARKFRHLAGGDVEAERVIAMVAQLETQPDLRSLLALCDGAEARA